MASRGTHAKIQLLFDILNFQHCFHINWHTHFNIVATTTDKFISTLLPHQLTHSSFQHCCHIVIIYLCYNQWEQKGTVSNRNWSTFKYHPSRNQFSHTKRDQNHLSWLCMNSITCSRSFSCSSRFFKTGIANFFDPPSGRTFEKQKTENYIFTWNIS